MSRKNILHISAKVWSLAMAVLLLTACVQRKNEPETYMEEESIRDTIPYTLTSVYEYSPYIQQKGHTLDTTFFRATFPLSEDEIFNELIFQSLHVDNKEDLEQSAQLFLESYNNYVEEAPNPELIHPWFQETQCDVPLHTPSLLVVRNRTSEYTGGAHGNYFELLYNYDLNKLELITLKDIFGVDKTKEILNIAEKYFRDQEGLDAQAPLDKGYFFDNGTFTLADNFAFSKNGLIFQYNPYEIKPYAEGLTTIKIPYSEIAHLLTELGETYIQEIKNYNN